MKTEHDKIVLRRKQREEKGGKVKYHWDQGKKNQTSPDIWLEQINYEFHKSKVYKFNAKQTLLNGKAELKLKGR